MSVIIDTPIRQSGYYGASNHSTDNVSVDLASNEEFLSAVLGEPKRFHYSSRDKHYVVNQPVTRYGSDVTRNAAAYKVPTVSLALQSVHQAFAAHVPFSLRPDTVWYFIVHEVAEYVRQNPDRCASLFTDTPEAKQTIAVRDDSLRYNAPSDWLSAINLFRDPLAAKVSDRTMELFLPSFSTSTVEDETALLVALMDAASPYYQFKMYTMCGIPQVRLEGIASDWRKLYEGADRLAVEFGGLKGYFTDLLSVLQRITETAELTTRDEDFWRSIYKQDDGSGGPFVNGWFTAFFAYEQTDKGPKFKEHFDWAGMRYGGYQTNEFPSHVSKVPFIWNYFGTEYQMAFAAGVTGVAYDNEFLSPRLGFAVAEV
jgi:hypothetical protein